MVARSNASHSGIVTLGLALLLIVAVFVSHGVAAESDMHSDGSEHCLASAPDPGSANRCSAAETPTNALLTTKPFRQLARPFVTADIAQLPDSSSRHGPPDLQIFRI